VKKNCKLRVLENTALRIFGTEGKEVKGRWRKSRNTKLHKVQNLTIIFREIKLRGIYRWVAQNSCTVHETFSEGKRIWE
jgi:hypothetical protein